MPKGQKLGPRELRTHHQALRKFWFKTYRTTADIDPVILSAVLEDLLATFKRDYPRHAHKADAFRFYYGFVDGKGHTLGETGARMNRGIVSAHHMVRYIRTELRKAVKEEYAARTRHIMKP